MNKCNLKQTRLSSQYRNSFLNRFFLLNRLSLKAASYAILSVLLFLTACKEIDIGDSGNGENRTVASNSRVSLEGAAISSAEGAIVSSKWTQKSGIPVKIENPRSTTASFIAPSLLKNKSSDLVFDFSWKDSTGKAGTDRVRIPVGWESERKAPKFHQKESLCHHCHRGDGQGHAIFPSISREGLLARDIEPTVEGIAKFIDKNMPPGQEHRCTIANGCATEAAEYCCENYLSGCDK